MSEIFQSYKKDIENDYSHGQECRESAAHDLVFTYVTHYDDDMLDDLPGQFKGEFDMMRGAVKSGKAELEKNPIQVDFEPQDEENEDVGEVMDGVYRGSLRDNPSIEAFAVGRQEMIVCGLGAWELYTEYESMRGGSNNQVIKRKAIHEANSSVLWDASAKMRDRSDAMRCTVIKPYTKDSYAALYKQLKGEDPPEGKKTPRSLIHPQDSNSFTWITGSGDLYYVGDHYRREVVTATLITFESPFGDEKTVWESNVEEVLDEMAEQGWTIVDEKETKRYQVTKYILSGDGILDESVLPGEYIPIIPTFGTLQQIEGQPYWEGLVRSAKFTQMLQDFNMSYLADIVSRSPRSKPVYTAEQIAGHEAMHSEVGSENNHPYLLINSTDAEGKPLPPGPISNTPDPTIPPALMASMQLIRQSMEDANPSTMPEGIPSNVANKTINSLMAKWAEQYVDMIEGYRHAIRYDGAVFASMASEIIDTPRNVTIVLPDGTSKKIKMQEMIFDKESGEFKTINDVYGVDFDVYSKVGVNYSTNSEQSRERIAGLMQGMTPDAPMYEMLLMSLIQMEDGDQFEPFRDYARTQAVIKGYVKPETEEEEQMLAQIAEQGNQPSAEMLIGMAEMKKADNDEKRLALDGQKMQLEHLKVQQKGSIDGFNAETKRMDTQIDAQEAGAKIDNTNIDTFSKKLDVQQKVVQLRTPQDMDDDELFAAVLG